MHPISIGSRPPSRSLPRHSERSPAERRSTAGSLGILVDDLYGQAAIATARRTGVAVAVAFERSGQEILDFEHVDWRDRLAEDPPDFVKVLIRHRADGESADVASQLERLGDVSEACAGSPARFLLELLTPYTAAETQRRAPSNSSSPAAQGSSSRRSLRSRTSVSLRTSGRSRGSPTLRVRVGCRGCPTWRPRPRRRSGPRCRCRHRNGQSMARSGGGRRLFRLRRGPQHLGRTGPRPRSRRDRCACRSSADRGALRLVHRHVPRRELTVPPLRV